MFVLVVVVVVVVVVEEVVVVVVAAVVVVVVVVVVLSILTFIFVVLILLLGGAKGQLALWASKGRRFDSRVIRLGRGDDTVGNPHQAQITQFELFELILLLKLNKQLPVERFEATASQSTVPSPPLKDEERVPYQIKYQVRVWRVES